MNCWTRGFVGIPLYLLWQNFCKLSVLPQLHKVCDFDVSVPAVWRLSNSPANVLSINSKWLANSAQMSLGFLPQKWYSGHFWTLIFLSTFGGDKACAILCPRPLALSAPIWANL